MEPQISQNQPSPQIVQPKPTSASNTATTFPPIHDPEPLETNPQATKSPKKMAIGITLLMLVLLSAGVFAAIKVIGSHRKPAIHTAEPNSQYPNQQINYSQ